MAIQKVRPQNRKEFMSKLVGPAYDPKEGTVPKPFSEPTKLGQPEQNRAYQTTVKGDSEKDFYIGIKDIDEAVMYYFNNVLKLSVVQNNARLNVPVIYGTPENWKSVQADGFYRDENGKLMAPLLMFKRSNVTQNRNLGNKLDGNIVRNVQTFEAGFNKRNMYGNFAVLNSKVPEKKYIVSITPDYITVSYQCILWTYFVEQMDKLIEAVNFASRSYWGDPNRFQFLSSIESFDDAITYNVGENRAVRCNFNLTINGYLIPDSVNKQLASPNIYYGVSKIIFGLETTENEGQKKAKINLRKNRNIKSVLLNDSVNNVNIINTGVISDTVVAYLLTNKSSVGAYVSPNTVTFPNGWLTAPNPLPAPTIDSFTFFANGQLIEKSSIVSFTDGGSSSTLVINPAALKYSFDPSDLILAIGKFS